MIDFALMLGADAAAKSRFDATYAYRQEPASVPVGGIATAL